MKNLNINKFISNTKCKVFLGISALPIALVFAENWSTTNNTHNKSKADAKTKVNNTLIPQNSKTVKAGYYTTKYYCPDQKWEILGDFVSCDEPPWPLEEEIKKTDEYSKEVERYAERLNKKVQNTKTLIELLLKVWESEGEIDLIKEIIGTARGSV